MTTIFSISTPLLAQDSIVTEYGKTIDRHISEMIAEDKSFKPSVDTPVVISIMMGASNLDASYTETVPKGKNANDYGFGLCALTVSGARKNIDKNINKTFLLNQENHIKTCFLWLDKIAKKLKIDLLTPSKLPQGELKPRTQLLKKLATSFFGKGQRDKITSAITAYLLTLYIYRDARP